MQTQNSDDMNADFNTFVKSTKDQTRGWLCCDDNHCILIFPFEEVTEDVRVNKKLEMSLNGHLAFS